MSNSLDNQFEYWNSIAQSKNFTHTADLKMLSGYIDKQAAVLDFGCGYGRMVKIFADNGYSNIAGFDTSLLLIERGQKDGVNNLFHIADPAHLPVSDNSVDCILLFAVLTCIPSNKAQRALIDLLHSKLNAGGIIYVSDYYLQEGSAEMDRYEYLDNDEQNYGIFSLPEGATFRHHTKPWIGSLFSGFEVKEEHSVEVNTMNGHKARAFQLIVQKV
ncbi:MAG: type 12 methyltransferase [Flavipsychrobacter sp.]|nr:type 12 methyltransferase [Flavipsychrobacter sp.]